MNTIKASYNFFLQRIVELYTYKVNVNYQFTSDRMKDFDILLSQKSLNWNC